MSRGGYSAMLKVIEERWPQTEVYLWEWHRHALERLLDSGATALKRPTSRGRPTA